MYRSICVSLSRISLGGNEEVRWFRLLFDVVGGTEEDRIASDIWTAFAVLLLEAVVGMSAFDFLVDEEDDDVNLDLDLDLELDVDVDVDEFFDIVGAVEVVLVDCVDRREDTDDDRFLLLRLLLGRPLLPRALDKLLSSPRPRLLFDLRVFADEVAVLGV